MEIEEEFDRIHKLGFTITIDWNMCFSVDYINYKTSSPINDMITILVCSYEPCESIKFIETMEYSIDIFYEWYNKHKKNIDKLNEEELFDITLGNISKRVKRDLNLDKLLPRKKGEF